MIAHHIAGQQGSVSPWRAHGKFHGRGKIPRMQILIRERSCFANCAAIERNPVLKRTRGNIKELPKKILAHVHRRNRVAADIVLQAAVEGDRARADMKNRRNPPVEISIVSVAVLDDVLTREKETAGGEALSHKA